MRALAANNDCMGTFANEPIRELRLAPERGRLTEALAGLDQRLPITVPVMIASETRNEPDFDSVDPSNPRRVVARATAAAPREVEDAVRIATEAQREWGARPVAERAAAMTRAADLLRERRGELAALAVRECAKPWSQADADVCEAIDFLEFYARAALALDASSPLIQMPGERNTLLHRARGVVAVIAPWNFPLAILTGMTAAGLVTGNAVCVKPAEQSPACGLAVVEALRQAGVPDGVLALLPGDGRVGSALVDDPAVHTIAFTGSSSVGLEIVRKASIPATGQRHLKRVIAEMGGKNCVIVDADADLDEVVPAVLDSAYAFAGQKCSAASRALVHERIADKFLERMQGALQLLQVGPAEEFETDVPPVIDSDAQTRIEAALAELGPGAELMRASVPAGDGYWVAPTIVTGASANSTVIDSELFGPVLTIEPVTGVDAACEIVDRLGQALTGGLFSRDPAIIERVANRTPVGNFYVNRATTGAMPGRQPFGGNRLSGTGFKAGGNEYLLQFVDQLVVTENTVRHGLPIE